MSDTPATPFGQLLKMYRLAAALSRERLAECGGVSPCMPTGAPRTFPGRLRELGQQARAVERLAAERQRAIPPHPLAGAPRRGPDPGPA
jgi:hypothetical protein